MALLLLRNSFFTIIRIQPKNSILSSSPKFSSTQSKLILVASVQCYQKKRAYRNLSY
jgi:hypothetical protein